MPHLLTPVPGNDASVLGSQDDDTSVSLRLSVNLGKAHGFPDDHLENAYAFPLRLQQPQQQPQLRHHPGHPLCLYDKLERFSAAQARFQPTDQMFSISQFHIDQTRIQLTSMLRDEDSYSYDHASQDDTSTSCPFSDNLE